MLYLSSKEWSIRSRSARLRSSAIVDLISFGHFSKQYKKKFNKAIERIDVRVLHHGGKSFSRVSLIFFRCPSVQSSVNESLINVTPWTSKEKNDPTFFSLFQR